MLRLLREGEEIHRPAPGEDDGSVDVAPALPSLMIRSSSLDSAATEALQHRLQIGLTTEMLRTEPARPAAKPARRGVNVDLRHLPVPRSERERLESLLGEQVAEHLASAEGASAMACVATSPGDFLSISTEIRDLVANPPADIDPNLPITILVLPPSGDVLTLEVFPSTSPALPPNEVRVGLATAVDWAKQIVAWTVCPPHHHQYVRRDSRGLARWMTVTRAENIDLLVFRKPKIFGIWFDIFHFAMPQFIDVFGGRFTRFTWYYD
jgi:hypothetical protein